MSVSMFFPGYMVPFCFIEVRDLGSFKRLVVSSFMGLPPSDFKMPASFHKYC